MKKTNKALIVLINFILILFLVSTTVFGFSDLIDKFHGSIDTSGSEATEVADKAGRIVGIIRVVGTAVSVGMIIVIGIKYVMGSVEEKAEYKKTLLPYLIGSILIFGTVNITQIIYDWAKSL